MKRKPKNRNKELFSPPVSHLCSILFLLNFSEHLLFATLEIKKWKEKVRKRISQERTELLR